MEKLNRAQKCSVLGPQNLGSRGGPGPRPPPDPHLTGREKMLNQVRSEVATSGFLYDALGFELTLHRLYTLVRGSLKLSFVDSPLDSWI